MSHQEGQLWGQDRLFSDLVFPSIKTEEEVASKELRTPAHSRRLRQESTGFCDRIISI
jgi:hypothetical protein